MWLRISWWNIYRKLKLPLKYIHRVPVREGATNPLLSRYPDLSPDCNGPADLAHRLKRSPFDSYHQIHSLFSCSNWYSGFIRLSDSRSFALQQVPTRSHFTCSYSTNCTSVCPPPTPSTQGECLPTTEVDSPDIQVPEPPNNCCMSGCANCVWITYAQELAQLYKDSGRAADSVMNAIDDPSLKVFLNLELKDKLSSED